jgi:pimeloyl-ACP methyl ester carboxylesterase
MIRGTRASLVAAFLIGLVGATACRLVPASEAGGWLLLAVVGVAVGVAARQPAGAWLALVACGLAELGVIGISGDPGGPFWYLDLLARLVIIFVFAVLGGAVLASPPRLPRRWRLATLAVAIASVVALTSYVGYAVARSGEYLVQAGEGDCRNPASAFGWTYEAINYDQADDARLLAAHPDPRRCFVNNVESDGPDQGERAGTEVVSADGIHVAGWYIPAGNGSPATGPTLVLVHGGKDNKSGMLKYAAPLHADYNLVLIDLRNEGRSTGDASSGGVLEALDLRAMIDWLERTKQPSWLGLVGNSNGAATVLAEVADDPRPQAIVLDSMHASVVTQLGNVIETEQNPRLPAWPSAWAVVTGASWRLGVDITSADPVRTITLVGRRPVLLLHGLLDTVDRPPDSLERNVAAALAAGVNIEVHVCPTGAHGTVIDACRQAWADWATHFLAVARGAAG